jgi:hypothetical protein
VKSLVGVPFITRWERSVLRIEPDKMFCLCGVDRLAGLG